LLGAGYREHQSLLTAIIAEDDSQFSNTTRIVYALESVNSFYEVWSELLKGEEIELVVVGCDSGSDKSFDFLGGAEIVNGVRETILQIWDRIVFYRHAKSMATIETIASTLPVYAQIAELENAGSISKEQAELLRRKTSGACEKFVEAGVMIPEMELEGTHSPRALMSPEPKLLGSPSNDQSDDNSEVESPDSIPLNKNGDTESHEQYEEVSNAELLAEVAKLKIRLQEVEDGEGDSKDSDSKKATKRRAKKPARRRTKKSDDNS